MKFLCFRKLACLEMKFLRFRSWPACGKMICLHVLLSTIWHGPETSYLLSSDARTKQCHFSSSFSQFSSSHSHGGLVPFPRHGGCVGQGPTVLMFPIFFWLQDCKALMRHFNLTEILSSGQLQSTCSSQDIASHETLPILSKNFQNEIFFSLRCLPWVLKLKDNGQTFP